MTSRLSSERSNQLSYAPRILFSQTSTFKQQGGTSPIAENLIVKPSRLTATSWLFVREHKEHSASLLHRKEVIQPQVPLRLPCYDFTPVMNHSLGTCPLAVGAVTSGAIHSHGVTGGVYKARERIHRCLLISDY